ncbi:glycoside hydrolase family 32 protein [Lactobacillus johnsonii]|uniref:Glycoside hydrolase family 32 protein n=1 Tax=Lactobacillus johnsonii TaxID=33959 RepID=A0A9X7T5U5_LACJH|nr:glycoside hydrolase family 32 protein [Lactobacillus johnsonii]QIA88499.1 glycoside hydrolase family 32 protein [Lactobacillus johnsonii]
MKLNKYVLSASVLVALGAGIGVSNVVHADSITSTAHESVYHLTTKDGWSNDLQSIVWNEKGKYYDLYFLHSETADDPNEAGHQNWYHTTTKDFVHFTQQNEAIKADGPEAPYTWSSAWTGTVLVNKGQIKGVPKGAQVAYFSGLEKHDGGSQNIWAAWSSDNGKTFSHVLNNASPVIDHSWGWTSQNRVDERDPAVVYWHGKMLMYVAEGSEIGVYQSKDGINWSKADPNGASKVGMGTYLRGVDLRDTTPVECPVLRTMKTPNGQTKQVLFFGAKAPHAGQTTGTYYIVGHLDSNGLFAPETDAKRLDQGSDYYGANFSGSSDLSESAKTIKSMGWIGNWSYTANGVHNDEAATSEFTKRLGSYSVARDLEMNNDLTIKSTPIVGQGKDVKRYTGVSKDRPINGVNASSNRPFTNGRDTNGLIHNLFDVPNLSVNKAYNLHFYNTKGNYTGRIYIDIWQGKDYVRFNYDPSNGKYNVKTRSGELDRGRNGQAASSYYFDGLLGSGNGYIADSGLKNQKYINLKVLTDKNSVEFFFPNGQTYTVARFNTSHKQDFKVFTEDPSGGNKVDITQEDLN